MSLLFFPTSYIVITTKNAGQGFFLQIQVLRSHAGFEGGGDIVGTMSTGGL
jgi:hypothetical protein